MENENSRIEATNPDLDGMEQDYISAINEIKANSVPKDSYAKLKEENQKLLRSLMNGETISAEIAKPKANIEELHKKFTTPNSQLSNLEFVKTTLELRDARIEAGYPDPFLPIGKQIAPTAEDIQKAEKVASIYQECIDYADGDSELFTQELMRRTADTMPRRKAR